MLRRQFLGLAVAAAAMVAGLRPSPIGMDRMTIKGVPIIWDHASPDLQGLWLTRMRYMGRVYLGGHAGTIVNIGE